MAVFLLLAVLIATAYGNALFNKFVWDDNYLIVENPYVKNFKFTPRFFKNDVSYSTMERLFTTAYYRPLSMLSFMVDYRIWRLNPFGYHLTNILLHLINSMLVFLIVSELFRDMRVSLLSVVLFALHPIHVEAVTPVLNRMGIQGAFFVLLALFLFIKYGEKKEKKYLLSIPVLFFAGLLSKEDTVTLPFVLLSYDYLFLSDLRIKNLLKKDKVFFYGACFLVCAVYLAIRKFTVGYQLPFPFFNFDDPAKYGLARNFFLHILTVIKVLAENMVRLMLPFNLSPDYVINPVESAFRFDALASIIILVLVAGIVFVSRRYSFFKVLIFFVSIFFISIFPTSNIMPIGFGYIAHDRFLYFPSVGFCAIFALFLVLFLDKIGKYPLGPVAKVIVRMLPFIVAFLYFVWIMTLNYSWRTDLTLWQYVSRVSPRSYSAHFNLGVAYKKIGRYADAEKEFAEAVSLARVKRAEGEVIYMAKMNQGVILADQGQYNDALIQIQEAIALAQKIGVRADFLYNELGTVYAQLGQTEKAQESFKKALAGEEDYVRARYNLGVLYYRQGNYAQAEEYLRRAAELEPDSADIAFTLGLNYMKQNKKEDAQAIFGRVLKIDPKHVLARQYLEALRKGGI